MIYVLFNKGQPVHVTGESPYTGTPKMKEFPGVEYDEVKTPRDFKSYDEVVDVAAKVSELTGKQFIGFDDGEWTSHRFGIMEPPKVGDEVSYGFNGDAYPCGTIVKITKGWRVTTSTGKVFNRSRKIRSNWLMVGGTWSLLQGHISRQNPEF